MTTYLEGIISVRAAIEGGNREIKKVYIDLDKYKKRDRKITGFLSFIKAQNVNFELCERSFIDGLLSKDNIERSGKTHGGVIAEAGERTYMTTQELLSQCVEEKGFLIYLDGVEDPYNLGYSYRALHASGASGIILPDRYRDNAASTLARSSAGASELLPTALFHNPESVDSRMKFISEIKKNGIALCCAAVSQNSMSLFEYDGTFPLILFIGGEKRGISPEFIDRADYILHIPYATPDIRYSLPTATVAALSGFHLHNIKKPTE